MLPYQPDGHVNMDDEGDAINEQEAEQEMHEFQHHILHAFCRCFLHAQRLFHDIIQEGRVHDEREGLDGGHGGGQYPRLSNGALSYTGLWGSVLICPSLSLE